MTTAQQSKFKVDLRWMYSGDIPEVTVIEKACFEFPWSEVEFVHSLRLRNSVSMVASFEGRIVGFMVYELGKRRIQLLNFAVAPEFRRRGVGARMMTRLIGKLSPERRTRISLEVRETNLAAQLFFHSLEFRATRILHDYYDDTPEDAYLMQFRLPPQVEDDLTINTLLSREDKAKTGPIIR